MHQPGDAHDARPTVAWATGENVLGIMIQSFVLMGRPRLLAFGWQFQPCDREVANCRPPCSGKSEPLFMYCGFFVGQPAQPSNIPKRVLSPSVNSGGVKIAPAMSVANEERRSKRKARRR
jgi:hypothetical protein